jgi:hypothetical protein
VNSYGAPATTAVVSGRTNQYTAILVSGSKALRCEFMAERHGGNGVCVDSDGKVYDLQIVPQ